MKKTHRNGKIEFMRFVFCISIMLHHIGLTLASQAQESGGDIKFFTNGALGVEFFFVVSGYLMANSAFKTQNNGLALGKDTGRFMGRKLWGVFPWFFVTYMASFIGLVIIERYGVRSAADTFINALPNLFLIQKSGVFVKDIMGVSWYIGDMLLAMLIIYPFLKKRYDVVSRIAAPVISLLLVGYLCKVDGKLTDIKAWMGFTNKTLLRAIAEILLGVFIFELIRHFKEFNFKKVHRVILTFVEIASYAAVLLFSASHINKRYEPYFLVCIAVAVGLSFSDVTYFSKIFNNKFVYFLGKASLPLYLCQSLMRRVVGTYMTSLPYAAQVLIFIGITAVFALILTPVVKLFTRCGNNLFKSLAPKKAQAN